MNSPKFLNYETRPNKFTERKMLVSCLNKICNSYNGDYQYVGLGGLTYTDFKLFHRELHIDDLISIEGGDFSQEKLEFNAPFSFVKIIKDFSSNALKEIDFSKRSIVWMDYDGALEEYMFTDLRLLFSRLPEGSVYLITCNRELKHNKTREEYTVEEFKSEFGNLVPFDITNKSFGGEENFKTLRRMFLQQINKTLKERNFAEDSNFEFKQLFNFKYQENRGAKMFTFGGLIKNKDFDLTGLDLETMKFVKSNDEVYNLKLPNITIKEMDLINSNFEIEDELVEKKIITKNEIKRYKDTYKYLPTFFDVTI